MAWQLPSKKNKSTISYLLIILAFTLLVWCVYLFFKFKIKEIEKGAVAGYEITQLRTDI